MGFLLTINILSSIQNLVPCVHALWKDFWHSTEVAKPNWILRATTTGGYWNNHKKCSTLFPTDFTEPLCFSFARKNYGIGIHQSQIVCLHPPLAKPRFLLQSNSSVSHITPSQTSYWISRVVNILNWRLTFHPALRFLSLSPRQIRRN